jgi:hypothetical protein
MKSSRFIPIAVLAFAVACNDPATAPAPGASPAITFKPRSGPTVDFASPSSGNLASNFDISGLGNDPANGFVTVEATAHADAVYACRNNGGNFPSDPKKTNVSSDVKVDQNFPIKNGRATGTLLLPVPANTTLTCPGGQMVGLASFTCTDVVFAVVSPPGPTADSSSPGIQDTYSKTFFNI